VSMSGISVKNSWPNCSPGHRLHITVKHRATVVKMKGRSGGKDHINDTECGRYFRESAQMGVGGGGVSPFVTSILRHKCGNACRVKIHSFYYRDLIRKKLFNLNE